VLISKFLKEMKVEFICKNEPEVDTLGIIDADINKIFCTFIDNEKYLASLPKNATLVITTEELSERIKCNCVCVVQEPRITFFELHNFLQNDACYIKSQFKTQIGQNCHISKLASISEKNVKIGNGVTVEEFVVIRENTTIGDNTIIRAGSIIGGEGFEFKRQESTVLAVKHLGGVQIGENVEIQYNTCIDRALYPWDNTIIGNDSKLDNLVQIGHAVKIGKRCFIAGQSLFGGRTVLDDDSWIGPGVTISNGIKIGKKTRVNIGSVVVNDVKDNESVSGNFAINTRKFLKHIKKIELS
jgi:UDP-3-O-[3-hydroxymyristoyl] glucosamine N-acyltransferase